MLDKLLLSGHKRYHAWTPGILVIGRVPQYAFEGYYADSSEELGSASLGLRTHLGRKLLSNGQRVPWRDDVEFTSMT